mgnify:FL=1
MTGGSTAAMLKDSGMQTSDIVLPFLIGKGGMAALWVTCLLRREEEVPRSKCVKLADVPYEENCNVI